MIDDSNRWKGGRGYKVYRFDVRDYAEVSKKALQTVRNDIAQRKFNPDNLRDVVRYCST